MDRLCKLFLLTCVVSALPQSQFQTNFRDYDDTTTLSRGRTSGRGGIAASSSRNAAPTESPNRETTTPVAILKQINEHNEDGSYTYGYEGSDGTFKLETRFADGTVQGKYGYVDVNGEVKIIEYGADAMGFKPEGDLPDGIIIPPGVEGDCTDTDGDICDYQYDYEESKKEEDGRQIVNRARGGSSGQSGASNNFNRGQETQSNLQDTRGRPAPPQSFIQDTRSRPAPLPSQSFSQDSRKAPPSQSFPSFQPKTQSSFLPAPSSDRSNPARGRQTSRGRNQGDTSSINARPTSQLNARPTSQLNARPTSQLNARPTSQINARPTSQLNARPTSQLNARPTSQLNARPTSQLNARPTSQLNARPTSQLNARPTSQLNSIPPNSAPSPPRSSISSSSSGGFSNFPAVTGVSSNRQRQSSPSRQTSPRIQEQRPREQSLPPPSFSSPNSFQSFPARPLPAESQPRPPPSRPAITFQDPPSSNLPPSALEVLDFNQLLGVFQGQESPRSSSSQSPSSIQGLGVFQTPNFPVRSS